jgi:CubicO group peptidase (beta-lactamase class C family)
VDSLVEQHAMGRGVPGIAVAVVSRERVVVRRAYGVRDVGTGLPVTPATPFNVASLTKPFTAIAALRLARDGRLRLDARAREYLPWLPERYASVTVRQLMTHTSGVARDLRRDNLDDPSVGEYRRRLDSADASGPPGARWEYSNTGYAILGWAVEAVAARPLAEVLREMVFVPLGMRQAGYREPLEGDPERARPHAVTEGAARPTAYVSGGFGSGGMIASGADLAAFAVALQEGLALDPAEQRLAWAPATLQDGSPVRLRMFTDTASYGLGWFITAFSGHRLLTHGGAIEGFSSNLYHFPDLRLTIVLLSNTKARDDGRAPVDSLAQALATFCIAHDACRPADPAPVREPGAALEGRR